MFFVSQKEGARSHLGPRHFVQWFPLWVEEFPWVRPQYITLHLRQSSRTHTGLTSLSFVSVVWTVVVKIFARRIPRQLAQARPPVPHTLASPSPFQIES